MVKLIVHAFDYLVGALRRTWSGRRNGNYRQCTPCCKAPASPLAASPVGGALRAAHGCCQRAENRLRRERRRALWLALHGIDVGPRVIHGVVVR